MNKPWLSQYPAGVPETINFNQYACLVELIEESFKKYSSLNAFSNMGKSLRYAEVDTLSRNFAAYLLSQGLVPGDRIVLMMPNCLQYPVCLFGALRAGLVVVNTNPLYTPREMKHQFNDSGAKAIVIAENFAANLEQIIKETPIELVITTGVGDLLGLLKGSLVNFVIRYVKKLVPAYQLPQAVPFNKTLKIGAGKPFKTHKSTHDDMVAIQYTGGTTGVSKGAMLSNKNLIANMLQVKAWIGNGVTEGKEVVLTPLPMYHIFSFTVNTLWIMSIGGESVLVTNPRDLPSLIKDMKTHKVTLMTGVNTLFNALSNNAEFAKLDFSSLRIVIGGAMAIQRPVVEKWKKVTGTTLYEGYGMTESSPVICVNPIDEQKVRIGYIGLPVPSTEVRLVNEAGQIVGIGEAGELQARGPQIMKGYYNRPKETAETISADGWLATGDIAIMEADGFFKIVDRKKDMILVSGFNVYPNEIEEVAVSHPKVLEAAAIGVPDPKSGEAVKLFIVKKDPSLTESELYKHFEEQLTAYKRPRFIVFREDLPKTNVGKVLRRELRDA